MIIKTKEQKTGKSFNGKKIYVSEVQSTLNGKTLISFKAKLENGIYFGHFSSVDKAIKFFKTP